MIGLLSDSYASCLTLTQVPSASSVLAASTRYIFSNGTCKDIQGLISYTALVELPSFLTINNWCFSIHVWNRVVCTNDNS